jgi:DNA-directed RNA polymerase specialized sigma24 family protein
MPTKRSEPPNEDLAAPAKGAASIADKIAAFVMLDAMKQSTQAEKSLRLKLVGFSNGEIAEMLQTSPAVVASNIYTERQKLSKKQGGRKGGSEPNPSSTG